MLEIIKTQTGTLATHDLLWQAAGKAANESASKDIFTDYKSRKATNTIRRQVGDLYIFTEFLTEAGLPCGDFANDPSAWRGVTWGIVERFTRWMLLKGYAMGTVNIRLSTVKTYAKRAAQSGYLAREEYGMIATLSGYQHKEFKRVDEARQAEGCKTRIGSKKENAVSITPEQGRQLKDQPDTPQGRRDRLCLCLLLDHGLRVGEVVRLQVDHFDLKTGELRFYRPKVDKTQIHKLTPDTLAAAKAYLAEDAPALGNIWRGSRKGNHGLTGQGITARAATERVKVLGSAIGVEGLSAHDLRHFWATDAVRNGTLIDRLQDAGGWSSLAMPMRYIESARIANTGVRLSPS